MVSSAALLIGPFSIPVEITTLPDIPFEPGILKANSITIKNAPFFVDIAYTLPETAATVTSEQIVEGSEALLLFGRAMEAYSQLVEQALINAHRL